MVTWLPIVLLTGVALLWLWLNVSPTMRNNASQRLEPAEAPTAPLDHWPHVVIVAPGRNEASFITTTLPQLCEQDYPNYHVVYIDDHSDDSTPAITAQMTARYPHLFVLRNEIEPPLGWVGKCWAVKRGYEEWKRHEAKREEPSSEFRVPSSEFKTTESSHAPSPFSSSSTRNSELGTRNFPSDQNSQLGTRNFESDLICLTDADINWHPQCLRTAVTTMLHEKADVVSLFPGMVFGSTVERVLMGTLTFALLVMFPISRAMDPNHPDTLTAGAFILTRRKLYDSIGGHEAVKNLVVEDVNLGRKLKAAGGKVWIAFTQKLISCRMYEGWSDIWEGLTKNAYAGMEYKPHWAAALLTANLFGLTLAPIYLLASLLWLALAPSAFSLTAVGLSAAVLLLQARVMNSIRKTFNLPARYAWSLPLGAALYFVIAIASIYRYYRGGNVWKGRSYGKETSGA